MLLVLTLITSIRLMIHFKLQKVVLRRLGDNSSQATIRPKRQFVPNSKKRQFVPSVNSSHFEKATTRHICKKRQFVRNCLIDQLITNLLKVEKKEIIKPTTNEFIQPRDNK